MSSRVALAPADSLPDQAQVAKPAKSPKLKVFRTPIGFHDAYVAAPSRKAALAAWGSDANLFARGVAEEVTDPALTAEPLAHPGEVVKRLRGTAAEQFAALPPDRPKQARSPVADDPIPATVRKQATAGRPPAAPRPKPDRASLDAAEQAQAAAEQRHRAENQALAKRESELARERRTLADRQRAEEQEAESAVRQARADYDRAMAQWRRGTP